MGEISGNTKQNNGESVDSKERKKKLPDERRYELILLGILTLLTLVMGFTPLGYIHSGIIIITFMSIPVTVAATLLRPRDSLFIGGIFGITSFIQAAARTGTLTSDLFQLDPVITFILCVVPRLLVGLLGGLIFRYINEVDKTDFISYAMTSLAVPVMNTLFFTTTLYVMVNIIVYIDPDGASRGLPPDFAASFAGVGSSVSDNIITFFVDAMGQQAILEAAVCFVLGTVITKGIALILNKRKKISD